MAATFERNGETFSYDPTDNLWYHRKVVDGNMFHRVRVMCGDGTYTHLHFMCYEKLHNQCLGRCIFCVGTKRMKPLQEVLWCTLEGVKVLKDGTCSACVDWTDKCITNWDKECDVWGNPYPTPKPAKRDT